ARQGGRGEADDDGCRQPGGGGGEGERVDEIDRDKPGTDRRKEGKEAASERNRKQEPCGQGILKTSGPVRLRPDSPGEKGRTEDQKRRPEPAKGATFGWVQDESNRRERGDQGDQDHDRSMVARELCQVADVHVFLSSSHRQ